MFSTTNTCRVSKPTLTKRSRPRFPIWSWNLRQILCGIKAWFFFCNTSSTLHYICHPITKCTPFSIKDSGVFLIQMIQNRLHMRSRTRFKQILVTIIKEKALYLVTIMRQRTWCTDQTASWTCKSYRIDKKFLFS